MNKVIDTKRGSTLFLRLAALGMGLAVLVLCLVGLPALYKEVNVEFRSIAYAPRTIITIMYIAAAPFFFGLYQTWKLLGLIDRGTAFSEQSVKGIKYIKYAASFIAAVYAISLPFFYIWTQYVDAPGLMVIGSMLTGAPLLVAVFAAVLQRLLGDAIALKSENDLTV